MPQRILVVDDEPDLCEILCFNLESEGFATKHCFSAEDALALLDGGESFDLLLLDVMMEHMSGLDLAKQLRARGDNTPIIFLTALGTEEDLLRGFDAGGDDYIVKPFSFPTVLARVGAVLRRSAVPNVATAEPSNDGNTLGDEALMVNLVDKSVTAYGMPVALTKKEYLILTLLMSNAGHHFSRQQIFDAVWDDDTYVNLRSVDVHIARLRKKLGTAADLIVNHTGFGFVYRR